MKTKNYIKHKKTYLTDQDGGKYAPYVILVEDYDYYVADAIRALASRNSGHEIESDWGSLQFEFFSKLGVKTFCKKVAARYFAVTAVTKAEYDVVERVVNPRYL